MIIVYDWSEETEKLEQNVNSVKSELIELKSKVGLSEDEKKNQAKSLNKKVEDFSKDIDEYLSMLDGKTDSSYDEYKTRLQVLKSTIKDITDLYNSIVNSGEWEKKPDEEKWFFGKAGDWIKSQREDVTSKDKWSEERWKNILRTAWFVATWVWAIALIYTWIKSIFWKEAREKRREKREVRRAERQKRREERKAELEALPFRQRPFWKFLKWTVIWSAIAWWAYGVYKLFDKWKTESIETKLQKISWLEWECKILRNRAQECQKLSHTYVADHVKNKKEYDTILENALKIQKESEILYNGILSSKLGDDKKKEAEMKKSSIDNYVEEIKAMKDDIYASVPEWWDEEWWSEWWSEWWNTNPEWENNVNEKYEPVKETVVTESAIDYLWKFKDNIPRVLHWRWDKTIKKWEAILNNYFKWHPILRKSPSKKIVFKIDDTASFWSMIKDIYDNAIPGIAHSFIPDNIKDSLKDISNTLKDVDAKTYEDIVFQHFWEIIKWAVKKEWWTMTVQEYYDSICETYPNKNAAKIASDLASSWQANKDIKDMSYPFA